MTLDSSLEDKMAEIIPFPGRKSMTGDTATLKETRDAKDCMDDIIHRLGNGEAVVFSEIVREVARKLGHDITLEGRLNTLIKRNHERIERYRSIVDGYTIEELKTFAKDADDQKIAARPFFYYAIVDALGRRHNAQE